MRTDNSRLSWAGALRAVLVAAILVSCGPFAGAPGASLDKDLSRIFAPWDSPDSPGAAVIVIRDGETIFRRGFGAADLESGTMISPETTVFNIASVSKQFTAFAALILAQDGRLDLDADVGQYLPWFPDFGTPVTSRHLIHHTSGLREYYDLAYLVRGNSFPDGSPPFRQQDVVDLMTGQRELNFSPGTDIMYCNSNYIVLAEVVEAVSGQSFQSFMAEAVFQPLDMDSTLIRGLDGNETATGYVGENHQEAPSGVVTWGESGVLTTTDDMALWARHLLNPSYQPEATGQLFEKGRLSDDSELIYAGGLMYGSTRGVETVAHGGSLPGFQAALHLVPSRDLAVVVLANTRGPVSRDTEVLEALLTELPEPKPDNEKISLGDYDTWVGRYVSIYDAFDLVVEGGELIYQASTWEHPLSRIRKHPIKPTVDGRFQTPRPYDAVARQENGRVQTIEVKRELSTLIYRRMTPTDPHLDLGAYVGTYRSDELDMSRTVEAVAGRLFVTDDSGVRTLFDP